jgi:hypothetical protein
MTSPLGVGPTATNWDQYGLADIWDMLKHEDGSTNANHVRAWAIMNELCDEQAKRLRATAAELAQRWPPERSPAAAVFIGRLEGMAMTFSDAAAAAGRNSGAVQNLTTGLMETRGRIKALRETWRYWEGKEAERVAAARKVLLPFVANLPDEQVLVMSNIEPAKTLVDLTGAPKVPTDWRHRADRDAREVMKVSDRDLNETRARLQQPPVMDAIHEPLEVWPPPPKPGGPGPGGGLAPSKTGVHSSDIPIPTSNPPPAAPGRSPWDIRDRADEPVLSGGLTGQPSSLPPQPSMPSAVFSNDSAGATLVPGGVVGLRLPTASTMSPDHKTGASRSGSGRSPANQATTVERGGPAKGAGAGFVAPPGGLIGGRPGAAGIARASAPSAGRRRRRNDPMDEWTITEGVPPVLEPPPEPEAHEPGPGVFGIDR